MHLLNKIRATGEKKERGQAGQECNSFRCHLPIPVLERWKDSGVAKNEEVAQKLCLAILAFCKRLGSLKVQSLQVGVGSSGSRTWYGAVSEFLMGRSKRGELERSTWGSWFQSVLRGGQTTGKASWRCTCRHLLNIGRKSQMFFWLYVETTVYYEEQ